MHLQGQQYVCAGELIALQTMTNVLNYLKVQKIDFAKVSSCSNFFSLILTMITVGWDFQRWKSEGNAPRYHQIVFWEGSRATESWRLYQARLGAWIRYHPSSWDRCTLPLTVPLGWGFTYRCPRHFICWQFSTLHPRISGRTALWTFSGIICKATLSCNLNVTECLTKTILLLPVNHERVATNTTMTTMDTGSPCPRHLPYYKHDTLPTYLPTRRRGRFYY